MQLNLLDIVIRYDLVGVDLMKVDLVCAHMHQ